MSNVGDILTALKSRIEAVVPSSWKELRYIYELEKNDFRTVEARFGAGVEAGNTVAGPARQITIDHTFFVVLARRAVGRKSDENERTAITDLYDKMELIQEEVFQQKLGIPGVVFLVSDISYDEPERIGDGIISLRGLFTIKHRK